MSKKTLLIVLVILAAILFMAQATNLGSINAFSVNNVGKVEQFYGATADVQLIACLAKYATCDATGYGATTQTISSLVEIGISGAQKVLILNPNTNFQPSSAAINMFQVNRNGQLSGAHIVLPNSMTYSGNAIQVKDTIDNNNTYRVDNVFVDASAETGGGITAGTCFFVSPPTGGYVQLVTLANNLRCNGLKYQMFLNAVGTNTYINGNNLSNTVLTGNGNLLYYNSSGLQIKGNLLNIQFEGLGTSISYTGSSLVSNNVCYSCYVWDTTTPVFNSGNGVNNTFIGGTDNPVTDSALSDIYLNTGVMLLGTYEYANAIESFRADGSAIYLNNSVLSGVHAFCDKGGNDCFSVTLGAVTQLSAFKVGSSGTTISDTRTLTQFVASLSTAAATSDNVAITGVTSSSHCQLTPTNASAATNIATTYVSAKTTNQITVTHTATGSMTYDISCSAN